VVVMPETDSNMASTKRMWTPVSMTKGTAPQAANTTQNSTTTGNRRVGAAAWISGALPAGPPTPVPTSSSMALM
jgi:hypothetical protein